MSLPVAVQPDTPVARAPLSVVQGGRLNQIAFSFVDEIALTPFSKSSRDLGFQRNNIFLDIHDQSLVARRCINACYWIVHTEPDLATHEVSLEFFRYVTGFTSRDYARLESVLRSLQKSSIEMRDGNDAGDPKHRWISVPLMGTVGIGNGKLVFQVPERIRRELTSSDGCTYLSLKIGTRLTSSSALCLWERLSALSSNPALQVAAKIWRSDWVSVEMVREWMDVTSEVSKEFKYFKYRVLDRDIKEINRVSDLQVSFEMRRESRRVAFLRFTIAKQEIPDLADGPPNRSKLVFDMLRSEFGLNAEQLNEISCNRNIWDDNRVFQAAEFTRDRINKGKVKASPAGYLMKAIREGLLISDAERQISAQMAAQAEAMEQGSRRRNRILEAETLAANQESAARLASAATSLEGFAALPEEDQTRLVRAFCASPVGRINLSRLDLDAAAVTPSSIPARLMPALATFLSASAP